MSNGNGNDVSRFTKWVKLISYIVTVVAIIGGGIWWLNTNFVSANDFNKAAIIISMNTQQIEVIRLERQENRVQSRIWTLDDKFGLDCKDCPPKYKQQYHELKLDLNSIRRRLKKLES